MVPQARSTMAVRAVQGRSSGNAAPMTIAAMGTVMRSDANHGSAARTGDSF